MNNINSSLGEKSIGRDNNLNLMRMTAACMVLASHSFVISSGDRLAEPWNQTLGMSPGGIAVDIFFVISGFLVTRSLLARSEISQYLWARALRIYPALWTALILSTIIVGIHFSTFGFGDFITQPQTWRYLSKNAVMIGFADGVLPAAFTHNPFPGAVNGSLWTLRYELRMYAVLALAWWALRLCRGTDLQSKWMPKTLLILAVPLALANIALPLVGKYSDFLHLGAMFFIGAAAYTHRSNLSMRIEWALPSVAAMVIGAFISPEAFKLIYQIFFPYVILFVAFGDPPSWLIWIRKYNNFGDYSYGIYIYAFPIQQAIVATDPGISTWSLTGWAGVCTAAMAFFSWHVVEKPALKYKGRFVGTTG